ncbi:MAG TPA: flagellar hook-length control protein FliK [Burkholderiaceae bacterium]|jgi:flagellar hook-length control protein FliK
MKPVPVINVAGTGPAPSVSKTGNGQQPETSFGQVLAQQTNGGPKANSPAPQTPSNTQNQDGNNTAPDQQTGSTSGTASSGKGGKLKSAHNHADGSDGGTANTTNGSANTGVDAGAASGPAQLLALVSNIQQPVTADGSVTTTTTDSSAALSALTSCTSAGNAQAALANFQAAVSSAADQAAQASTGAALKDASLPSPAVSLKDAAKGNILDSNANTASAASTPKDQAGSLPTVDVKSAVPQPALDLAAAAQKDIAAGLADLDAAAARSAAAIDSASNAAATAIPVAQNILQTTGAAAQVIGANDKLTPQVGSSGWDQALGQKVVWMVAGGQQSASLTLNPPDLGPMQVVLNVTNSHATATFTAAQPEVRQALESAMPKLREMLGDAGIQLGQTSVNAGNAQQQQNFAEQSAHKSNGSRGQAVDPIDTRVVSTQPVHHSGGIGLVDTFA